MQALLRTALAVGAVAAVSAGSSLSVLEGLGAHTTSPGFLPLIYIAHAPSLCLKVFC